uniref:Uncharacterized protein n=1 Tax=Siphoviridae sp. ctzyE57 TaxID=2827982 RepID=A0A8S5SGN3_9CAUD|nr:MAG TPA: hypothetical protein [Siphoviridae sp. ctzyE57]
MTPVFVLGYTRRRRFYRRQRSRLNNPQAARECGIQASHTHQLTAERTALPNARRTIA